MNNDLEGLTEEQIDENLDLISCTVKEEAALRKLSDFARKFEKIKGSDHDFALTKKEGENTYLLVDKIGVDEINHEFILDQLDWLFEGLTKILEAGDVILVGTTNKRSIHEVGITGKAKGEPLMSIITPYDGNNELSLGIAERNNNLMEEIFRFTQSIQFIPESEWKIEKHISESGPIGIPLRKNDNSED